MENKTEAIVNETIDMREVTEDNSTPVEPTTDAAKAEEDNKQQPKTSLWKSVGTKVRKAGPVKTGLVVTGVILGYVLIKKGVRAVRAAITPLREIESSEPLKALADTPAVKAIPDNLADVTIDIGEIGTAASDAQQAVQAVQDTQEVVQTINTVGEAIG